MAMHNPPDPGEFIIQVYLDPNSLSGQELARKLGVAASTLNRSKRADPFKSKPAVRHREQQCSEPHSRSAARDVA